MPWWQWSLDIAGVLLAVILCYGIALVIRRRVLARNGSTFELSYRVLPAKAGRGWLLGIGRYAGDSLQWFRVFSLSPRPKRNWPRSELAYRSRREPEGVERMSLYAGHVVVECCSPREDFELALSPQSLTGFQSWLEASPPGTHAAHSPGRGGRMSSVPR